jgi:class 3 adenylate cyclase
LGYREFHYRWTYDLRSSPETLWPLITDTNRFDRDTGNPEIERLAAESPNARQRARLRRLGVVLEWEEEPFEWIRPHRFGVTRSYKRGPIAELRVLAELARQPKGGTRLTYQVWSRPRNPVGLLAIPIQIGLLSARRFAATFRAYDRIAAAAGSTASWPTIPPPTSPIKLPAGGRERLARARTDLLAQGASPDLVTRLTDTIEHGDELTLARLRPYTLADAWSMPRQAVLELCLWATRIGLLEFRWDLLCPLCRGAKETASSLGELRSEVHCDTCLIDFSVNFDRSVELTFRPNPAIRAIDVGEFCVGGPQVTPHIAVQQLLRPEETRTLAPSLEPGRYRLRTMSLRGGLPIIVDDSGLAAATIRAAGAGWHSEELHLTARPQLSFENATGGEQLFILERTAWGDQATTAADVIALQVFRDLFSQQALRPGQQISVGSLTILFTDLRDSTRLYRRVGDAPAFGLVMTHFDVLRVAIAAEEGAIVKTIGDAVMAVFRRPIGAILALQRAMRDLAAPADDRPPLSLKAGIHYGPCIAVTLNDRLDYFGSTVNIAARLEGQSRGGDIIISNAIRDDPEVAALLGDPTASLHAEPLHATLKGLDDEQFALWRLLPGAANAPTFSASTCIR